MNEERGGDLICEEDAWQAAQERRTHVCTMFNLKATLSLTDFCGHLSEENPVPTSW